MKIAFYKSILCFCLTINTQVFAQVRAKGNIVTSEQQFVSHNKWQLAQRQANLEQQLGYKPELNLDTIDTSKGKLAAEELEVANEILKSHEKKAFGAWLSNPIYDHNQASFQSDTDIDHAAPEVVEAMIAGSKVKASNLGVILDVSGSMSPYLQKLRAQILEAFPKAHFVEIVGCRLAGNAFMKDFYSTPGSTKNPFDPGQFPEKITPLHIQSYIALEVDTLSAMAGLIKGRGVDSIFWFSDLNDGISDEASDITQKLIKDHRIRLVITSLHTDISKKDLRETIESYEGSITITDGNELKQ